MDYDLYLKHQYDEIKNMLAGKEENIQNESEDKKDLDIKNSVKSMKKLKISWVNEDNIKNSLDNNQDHKKKEYIF